MKNLHKGKNKKNSLCRNNINFLSYIHSLPIKKRNKIIKLTATPNEINSIIEIFINFIDNGINCKKKFVQSVKKYSTYFHKLIKKSRPVKQKRGLLTSKTGGFLLQGLLAIALPVLKQLFS